MGWCGGGSGGFEVKEWLGVCCVGSDINKVVERRNMNMVLLRFSFIWRDLYGFGDSWDLRCDWFLIWGSLRREFRDGRNGWDVWDSRDIWDFWDLWDYRYSRDLWDYRDSRSVCDVWDVRDFRDFCDLRDFRDFWD